MGQVTKQLYTAFSSPYERNLATQPAPVYPNRPVTNGGLAFRLGRMRLELPGVLGAVIDRAINYNTVLSKFRSFLGIKNGGIATVSPGLPVFFHKPDEMDVVDVPVGKNRVLRVNYEDYFNRHPDLRSPYEVTVTLEYVQKHPYIEANLAPDIRKRIYDDLALSGYSVLEIDTDKYVNDPNYSAAVETAKRLAEESFVGTRNYIEPAVAPTVMPRMASAGPNPTNQRSS